MELTQQFLWQFILKTSPINQVFGNTFGNLFANFVVHVFGKPFRIPSTISLKTLPITQSCFQFCRNFSTNLDAWKNHPSNQFSSIVASVCRKFLSSLWKFLAEGIYNVLLWIPSLILMNFNFFVKASVMLFGNSCAGLFLDCFGDFFRTCFEIQQFLWKFLKYLSSFLWQFHGKILKQFSLSSEILSKIALGIPSAIYLEISLLMSLEKRVAIPLEIS